MRSNPLAPPTINISSGGKLDLKPAGDATPDNVSVDVLNITDGSLTHFATLLIKPTREGKFRRVLDIPSPGIVKLTRNENEPPDPRL